MAVRYYAVAATRRPLSTGQKQVAGQVERELDAQLARERVPPEGTYLPMPDVSRAVLAEVARRYRAVGWIARLETDPESGLHLALIPPATDHDWNTY